MCAWLGCAETKESSVYAMRHSTIGFGAWSARGTHGRYRSGSESLPRTVGHRGGGHELHCAHGTDRLANTRTTCKVPSSCTWVHSAQSCSTHTVLRALAVEVGAHDTQGPTVSERHRRCASVSSARQRSQTCHSQTLPSNRRARSCATDGCGQRVTIVEAGASGGHKHESRKSVLPLACAHWKTDGASCKISRAVRR